MQLKKPLNKYIDHTLLRPDATHLEFEDFLDEAVKYQFASVCVSPYIAGPIAQAFKHEDVKVCTVVGFPHGNVPLQSKLHDVLYLAKQGVEEIDFVINYGDLKSGRFEDVGKEIEYIGRACYERGVTSKCIIETCYLTQEEKMFMLQALYDNTKVDYIKTSTGFGTAGAQLDDVAAWNLKIGLWSEGAKGNLIQLVPAGKREQPLKIKAAGGIRDLDTALKFIECGADRLGMSAGVKVMEEWNARQETFTAGEEEGRETDS